MRFKTWMTIFFVGLFASVASFAAEYKCDLMYGYAGMGSSGKARTIEAIQVDGRSVSLGAPLATGESQWISMRTNSVTRQVQVELTIPGVGMVGASSPAGSNTISLGFNLYEGTDKATLVNLYCFKTAK